MNKMGLFVAVQEGESNEASDLYMCTGINEYGVPEFDSRRFEDFLPAERPQDGLHGLACADYDNNGYVDLFAGADSGDSPRLYKNEGGDFVDAIAETGVALYAGDSWSASWADYDDDGWIDLAIGRADQVSSGFSPDDFSSKEPYLLKNDINASGLFVDKSDDAGWQSLSGAFLGVTWADIEADGDPDIFLSNILEYAGGGTASARLYINNGDGTFDEASMGSRFPQAWRLQGIAGSSFIDFDNDGDLDLTRVITESCG